MGKLPSTKEEKSKELQALEEEMNQLKNQKNEIQKEQYQRS